MKTFGDLLADLRHRIRNRFGETEASIEAVRGSAIGICVWTIRTMVIAGLAYGLAIGGFGVHGDSLAKLSLYIVISGLVAFGANHLAALADLRPSGMPMLAIATLLSFNPIAVPLWAVEPSMVPFFYLVLIVVASFLSEWRTVAAVSGAAAVMVVLMASQNPWVMHKSGDSVVVACMVCGAIACLLVVRNSLFSSMLATTEKQVESAYTDVSRVRIAMANQRRETYTYEEFQRKLSQVLGYVEHSMSSGAADVGAGLEAAKNDIQSLADDLVEMRRYADLIAESSAEVPNFLRHDRVVRTLAENIESALAEMTRFGVMGRGIASDSSTLLTNLDEIRRQRARSWRRPEKSPTRWIRPARPRPPWRTPRRSCPGCARW